MTPVIYQVADDDGFLALVDPDAYAPCVATDWTPGQLKRHLTTQMSGRRLLIWGTGREEVWRVQVVVEPSGVAGVREVTGPIVATRGRLLLAGYGSLTMAVAYDDVTLPESHHAANVLHLPASDYHCRILQMQDPEADVDDQWIRRGIHVVIELVPGARALAWWSRIPWVGG